MLIKRIQKSLCLLILSFAAIVDVAAASEQISFDKNQTTSAFEIENINGADSGDLDHSLSSNNASFIDHCSSEVIYRDITALIASSHKTNPPIRAPPSGFFQ